MGLWGIEGARMRNGICPKCGQGTVYTGRDSRAKASSNNMIPIDFQHHVALDNYVCTTCGYLERYISATEALQHIEQTWQEATLAKRKRLKP